MPTPTNCRLDKHSPRKPQALMVAEIGFGWKNCEAAAGPTDSVANLALNWGFRHCGRFAVEYRLVYGESPSQTAKKSGPRQPWRCA